MLMSKKADTYKPVPVRDRSFRMMRPTRKPKQHRGRTEKVASISMMKGVWCDQTGKRMMLADDRVWQLEEGLTDGDVSLDTPGATQLEASSDGRPQELGCSQTVFAGEPKTRKTRGDTYVWDAAIAHCDRQIEIQGYPLACIQRFLRHEIEVFFEKNSINGIGPSTDWIRRVVQRDKRFRKYRRR